MSAYYAAPSVMPADTTVREEPAPVLVAVAGPVPQSRLTVLFRAFLIVPHLFALWALAIAAYMIAIIGWFGAASTGRLPVFAADYLTRRTCSVMRRRRPVTGRRRGTAGRGGWCCPAPRGSCWPASSCSARCWPRARA